jgi:hypothetical protein
MTLPNPSPDANVPLHIVVALMSALFGTAAGASMGWWLHGAPEQAQVEVESIRDYTEEEFKIACLPYMRQTASTLEQAQVRVDALAIQVRDKENEVSTLATQFEQGQVRGQDLQEELMIAQRQLSLLRDALVSAKDQKDQLIEELEETKTALSSTRSELVVRRREAEQAKLDAIRQRWAAFKAATMLEVCERGNRPKVDRCREIVDSALLFHEGRFEECIASGQAIPVLRFRKRNEELPTTAAHLDEDNKITKDWYILFCDPELPEASERGLVPPLRSEGSQSDAPGQR